jgi:hypothetical protein
MTLPMSKFDVCTLHVVGITESWQQEPLFTLGTCLPFSTGPTGSEGVLTYVNNLSPQKQWRKAGGNKYFNTADCKKIVKIMYLECTKSGKEKECVTQEKEPAAPGTALKRQKAPLIEGNRSSKCGCKAKIQVNWETEEAETCQVGDCSWVHTGTYVRTLFTTWLSSFVPCAGHESCNEEMSGLRFSDLSLLVKREILTFFTSMIRNPPFAMAHAAAIRIACKYVLKEAVKRLLRAANSQRVEDSRSQIIRDLHESAVQRGVVLSGDEVDYLDASKSQSERLLRYLRLHVLKFPGTRFIAEMGIPSAEHIIRLTPYNVLTWIHTCH